MVSIRMATDADREDLERLAQRDSAVVPKGEVLVAFEDGVLRAALEPSGGGSVADPFHPSAPLIDALRAFAGGSAATTHPTRELLRMMPFRHAHSLRER